MNIPNTKIWNQYVRNAKVGSWHFVGISDGVLSWDERWLTDKRGKMRQDIVRRATTKKGK
jgi:hypothetical protein